MQASLYLQLRIKSSLYNRIGLDVEFIKALPMFAYESERIREWATECFVCLFEFQDGEKMKHLRSFNHSFHAACIDIWFYLNSHSIALCRTRVDPNKDGIAEYGSADIEQNTSRPELERPSSTEPS
ncbi:hypothetical protein SUGI_0091630 [Cryptomeria japonica]|uniref:RING-H2 finger protein ATL17-like n=1 Tax=Cryptomeria japonica TaxID=3369 RepID=UPI002408C877|nr:RING-H2 finger protein ATL17-like [Cryptomeria japonica]GLJ08574.1 hypothetical protein SUGI_0091630 [Cryptomeria japonica]